MNSYDSLHAPQAESGWKTWVDLTTRMRSDALSPADWEHFYPKYRSLIIMYGNKQKLSRDQIRELIDRVFDTLRAKDKISCYDPSRDVSAIISAESSGIVSAICARKRVPKRETSS